MSDLRRFGRGKGAFLARFFFTLILSLSMILSGIAMPMTGGVDKAYAKSRGSKNQQACENCEAVRDGEAPTGKDYSSYVASTSTLDDQKAGITYGSDGYATAGETYEELLNGAVYRGGNSRSGLQDPKTAFDTDPDDFAKVLPYGDTYIDTSKITFGKGIVEMNHPNFMLISSDDFTDSKGNPATTDPFGDGRGLASRSPIIAYVGRIKGYLGDSEEEYRGQSQTAPKEGNENIFEDPSGLYRITYPGAVTLKDGTKGNLVFTVTRVEIETTATDDQAIITLQTANNFNVSGNTKDASGEFYNTQKYIAKTKAETEAWLDGTPLRNFNGWPTDKSTGTATGAIIDFEINITNAEGSSVGGSISYAARDMDLDNYQDLWGRKMTEEDRHKFNEALAIKEGALSYAVTPYYDHANATTRATGWIPVIPGVESDLDSPLNIEKTGTDDKANGVRFSGTGAVVMRDKNGTFENALVAWGDDTGEDIRSSSYGHHRSAELEYKDPDDYTIHDNIKKQLVGKIKNGSDNVAWDQMTNRQIFEYLGKGSYGTRRGDDGTFDTGFAVLLDASGTKMQWSGSMQNNGNVVTTIFDTSVYTYVEQTHGTGGGIYIESYDLSSGTCDPMMLEGTVTMGRNSETTVTAVPEDGHRVSKILIGNTNYGQSSDTPGLTDKNTYIIDGNEIKDENGTVLGTFSGGDTVKGFDDLKTGSVNLAGFYYDENGDRQTTDQKIAIERNKDGSVDITLPIVDNPMHVHADFAADYYFYKIWKGVTENKVPVKLNMTAAPYAFVFNKVTIEGVEYKINGREYTGGGDTYELNSDDILEIGDKSYKLQGNVFVGPDGTEYPIKLKYGKNKNETEESFIITRDDAQSDEEPNVVELGPNDEGNPSPGNYVWKIKYPSEGYTTESEEEWPALPIETEPESHAYNHVERNYWFTTEEAPGWAMFNYDNSEAKAPGVVSDDYYENTDWYKSAVKDYEKADETIKDTNTMAYMSVFSKANDSDDTWGGIITNTPGLIVKIEKKWDDLKNKYHDRKGILWFHIDKVVTSSEGTTTITKDILPPQSMKAAGVSGDGLIKTWGDKTAYDTQASYGKVVGTLADLPSQTESGSVITYDRNKNGSYTGSDGTTYWLNELAAVDGNGNKITYQIRETDAKGVEVNKDDVDKYLLGYKTEIDEWEKFKQTTTPVDQAQVDTYSGEVRNNLQLKDIDVTKEWIGPAPENVKLSLINNAETDYMGRGEEIASVDVKASDFTEAGKSTRAYSFKDIPKYIDGKLADYAVVETPEGEDWSAEVSGSYESGSFNVTNTNNETVEIPVKKVWDDGDNQDGIRPDTLTYNLKAGGEVVATEDVDVDEDGTAEFTFTKDDEGNDLRKYDAETGKEISYSVEEGEIEIPEGHNTGYSPTVTGNQTDGFTVTNTHVPETVKITIEKQWKDGADAESLRPSTLEVVLKGNDEVIDTVTLEASDWKWTSGELPKYKDGEEIEYTAVETVPDDYGHDDADNVTDIDGERNTISITVKNVSLTAVSGNKEWVGDDKYKEKVRPERLTVQLQQTVKGTTSDVPDQTKTIGEDDNWSYDFGKLPAYDDDENKITYSVKEVEVPSAYTQSVDGMNLVNTLVDPPVGEDTETYGKKGDPQTQDATEMFTKGTGEIQKYELIDPETGEPTDQPVPAYDEEGNEVGTYTIDENGKITFTPDPDFVGTPTPVTVRATDENGLWADADYTPHVKDTTTTVKRKISWVYYDDNKTPVREEVEQEATFIGEVDPKTGEIISWGDPQTMDSIENPKVEGWNPDITVPTWTGTPDNPPKDVEVIYYPEPPKGTPKKTVDYKNKKQSSKIEFTVTTPTTPDGSKNKIEKMLLVDPVTGKESSKVTVKGEGTYSIDKNGNITFTPEKDFVGKTSGIKVVGYDSNGYKAETTYTPEVLNSYTVTYTDPATGRTIKKTVAVKDGYPEPDPPADPTRKGYKFTGWNKVVTYDSKGNVESIVYEATWEPLGSSSGSSSGSGAKTGDSIAGLIAAVAALGVALAVIIVMIIRRRRSS